VATTNGLEAGWNNNRDALQKGADHMSSGTTTPPTWNGDPGKANGVKDLFTESDISCMKAVYKSKKIPAPINLDEYENVQRNAMLIYGMVKNQRMPQGGPPWTDDMLGRFKDWMDAGCPKG
jgi:hypothetical protein